VGWPIRRAQLSLCSVCVPCVSDSSIPGFFPSYAKGWSWLARALSHDSSFKVPCSYQVSAMGKYSCLRDLSEFRLRVSSFWNSKSFHVGAHGTFKCFLFEPQDERRQRVSLYKIFVHLFFCMHELIIPLSPPPICITHTTAILLRDFCAMYDLPPTLPFEAIHHTILIMLISCKGQPARRAARAQGNI